MEDALVALASLPYLAPVAKNLLHAISYGIKRFLEPYFIAREEKMKAKTELEIFRTSPLRQIEFAQEFIKNADGKYPTEAVKEMRNTIDIIMGAIGYSKDISADIEHTDNPDDEWYARFFDEAKYISDKELQDVWARLLSERVIRSLGINNRVLYFIRDLDKEEIRTICRALRLFINDSFMPKSIADKVEDFSTDIVTLLSLGIVTPGSSFSWSATVKKGDTLDAHGASFEITPLATDKTSVEINCFCLTPEGKVLSRLSNEFMSPAEAQLICNAINEYWIGKAEVKVIIADKQ